MKTGVPWQLKGARPHVREAAREAARRAGMSVSEWLDTVITDSADNDVIEPARRLRASEDDDRHDDFEDVTRYQDSESGPRPRRGKYADYDERHRRTRDEDLAAVTERLDTLSRLLEERQFQERQLQEQMLQEQRLQERPFQERQPQVPGPDMAAVNERLDALSRQLAEVAQATQAAQATQLAYAAQLAPAQTPLAPSPRHDDTSHQLAGVISKLDRRLDQLIADGRSASAEIEKRMSAVDRAVAQIDREPPRPAVPDPATPLDQALVEIAERQRALDGEAGLPRSDLPRAPTQGLNGLEQQLRQITTQIESLRPCNVNGVVETLRDDLAEIGVMVKEAMPRRAMETLESEVRSLVQRIDSKRHTGGETPDLAGVERGLVQVRDSLRDDLAEIGVMLKEAMPRRAIETLETEVRSLAQRIDTKRHAGADGPDIAGVERGLAEVRDALRALTPAENLVGYDEAVRSLSKKIDGIAASTQDPAALEQLEGAIAGLRGIVSHVASNAALATLSEEVRSLARKVEQVASSDVVALLEQRIGAIADALQARPHTGQDARDLDAVVHGLTEKLEQLQLTRSDQVAVNHLEDRIVNLVQKLDASDARLSHLETIERGLAELLIHLEHQRLPQLGRSDAAPPPEVDTLKRDFQKTQDSLEAVHGALGHVVDRLAMIENGLRSEAAPSLPKASNIARIPAPPPPAPPVSPPAPPKAPAPVAVAAPPIAQPAPAPIAAPPPPQQPP
ncbi:MAG: localization factor PodJL, partial [Alphaproteobacteria bacterium]|nr:localization factor PodJL [Alphaproteobacteria bacterium]